jgi:hypothetical protein
VAFQRFGFLSFTAAPHPSSSIQGKARTTSSQRSSCSNRPLLVLLFLQLPAGCCHLQQTLHVRCCTCTMWPSLL